LYQLVLCGWMRVFGTSALSAMWLHVLLFGLYELIVLAIFRRLRTPPLCVNLAGLFLLAVTFHDRPDSLAHVLGMAAVYACGRSRRSLGAEAVDVNETSSVSGRARHSVRAVGITQARGTQGVPRPTFTFWSWAWVVLVVFTFGTSLQIGAFYLLFVWLVIVAGKLFAKEQLPLLAMAASVLIPIGLGVAVRTGLPHLWAGFLEHARITPSISGLRLPEVTSILKVIRTVPAALAASVLLPWLLVSRKSPEPAGDARLWLMAGAGTATALAVIVASLLVVTANMVAIAAYLQPLIVGTCLALVMTQTQRSVLPRSCRLVAWGLALIVSIRAIGMSTWGAACAKDMSYTRTLDRLRQELAATAPGGAVVVSAAYLYETARHDALQWIHADWPGKPDSSGANRDRDALVALKPAKLIVTQFDYYRRYEAVLSGLETRPELVEFRIVNTAKTRAPDSIKPLQRVVQHISWAPVVVDFSWRQPTEKPNRGEAQTRSEDAIPAQAGKRL
jgi:hypothetical protein